MFFACDLLTSCLQHESYRLKARTHDASQIMDTWTHARDVAEVGTDFTITTVALNVAGNNFKGGHTVQLSSCAQCCTVCTGLKSDVQHLHDSGTRHEKCRRILKHVLKPYDSRSHNQNVRMTCCLLTLPDASSVRYKSRIRQS